MTLMTNNITQRFVEARRVVFQLLKSVILLFILQPVFTGFAQKLDLNVYRQKYPGESRIILDTRSDISIDIVNDKLQIDMKNHEETLCMDKNVLYKADQGVSTSGFFKVTQLSAKTLVPTKFGYKAVDVEKFDTSDFSRSSTFYDDVKSINFTFPKVEEGSRTVIDYTYHINEPRYLSSHYFSNYIPVENSELSVSFPANVNIAYKLMNCDSLKIDFTKKQVGNKIVYQWKANRIPKLSDDDDAPSVSYYAAHMFIYITDYTVNGMKIKVLSNISDLFSWYQGLVSQINKGASPALKTLVDSLTTNTNGELDKVKNIYYWVQDHIKYIAFEAGRGGFVPRDADVVFTKRYGDCKDMASIINKMLELAGIESYMTWIGTRHLPYRYDDLPLPAVDNHMIVTYKYKGRYYYLDATPGQHPFNYPSYVIQGKEALIDLKDNYEVANVPEIDPSLNLQADTIKIKLEGKKIVGSGISYFRGYSRVDMYNHIAQKSKIELTTFLKSYFQKGNNKFLIDNFDVKNLDERDKDLVITYNFNLGDYATIVGNEVFLNMNMDKIETGGEIKDTKTTPLEIKYKKQMINHVIFEMPEGYKITYVPGNSEFKNDLFGFKISYKTESNKVCLTQNFYTNFLLLQHMKFQQWNTMLDSLRTAYKTSVNLKKEREP
jgi:transglutaminase-like putative cysteine protease